MIREQSPGKLFIAGEYAVVEPGEPSVLVAVDRHVAVEVEPAHAHGSIASAQYRRAPLRWTRDEGVVVLDEDHGPYDYVLSAIAVIERLVQERGGEIAPHPLAERELPHRSLDELVQIQ